MQEINIYIKLQDVRFTHSYIFLLVYWSKEKESLYQKFSVNDHNRFSQCLNTIQQNYGNKCQVLRKIFFKVADSWKGFWGSLCMKITVIFEWPPKKKYFKKIDEKDFWDCSECSLFYIKNWLTNSTLSVMSNMSSR